jgi:hypothetical protein
MDIYIEATGDVGSAYLINIGLIGKLWPYTEKPVKLRIEGEWPTRERRSALRIWYWWAIIWVNHLTFDNTSVPFRDFGGIWKRSPNGNEKTRARTHKVRSTK